MKKILLLTFTALGILFSAPAYSQYCTGTTSGSSVCTASTTLHTEGFSPPEDSLPCIVDGQAYSQIVQVHTPATVTSGGSSYNLSYIKVDTISNLPCGMCWAMGASNYQIAGNATGCIRMSGTTYDAPGEYLLHIIVDATVTYLGFPITQRNQNLASQGLRYYVRVQLPGDTCIRIDTLANGNTASHAGSLAAPTISGNTTICSGGTTTLTASGSNIYAYAWSNGTFASSITVNATGTYTVTVYGNCTSATASKTVTLSAVRDTITSSGPTAICYGDNVTLTVPSGSAAYHWSTGATVNSISVNVAGNYTVTVTNANSCSSVSQGVTVTVNPVPVDTISASGPLAFCPAGSVTLSGPPGLSYNWSNGNTTQTVSTSQNSIYILTVTNNYNCSAVSAPVTVTVYPTPDNTVTLNGPTTFCAGGSVILSGQSPLSYAWSTGETTQDITATQSGSYTLTVTNNKGCTAVSNATVVTVIPAPAATITASGPVSFCDGGSVSLTADAGVSGLAFNWSEGSNAQAILATVSGSYTVTVTDGNNCTAVSQPTQVTVNTAPSNTVTASGPTVFCSGNSVLLTAASGQTYLWSNGSTGQSVQVSQSGNYVVTITSANNCSAVSNPVPVTVYTAPNNAVTAGGPVTFCSGGSVTLTASGGLTYSWSNGATTQSVQITQTGSYTVTVSNVNNCTAVSQAISVVANALPDATVSANGPTTFCPGSSVTLNAAQGLSYTWSNGLTTQSIVITQAGSYTVTVSNSNQCSAVSTATTVSLNHATTIATQPASQVTCLNAPVDFSVLANGDNLIYQWQKNGADINGQNGTSYNIPQAAFADTGNYTVIVSGLCGKDTSGIAVLTVTGSLTFSQQPVSKTACQGSSVSFSVIANGVNTAYQWQKNGHDITNANSSTYTINSVAITDTGSYSCNVTSSCGNATSGSATLTVNFPTSSTISRTICGGSSFNFNGHILRTAGTYTDTLVNAHNCDSIITLSLTVTPPLTYSYNDSVCSGNAYNFNGTVLTTAGTYKDTLQTSGGCDSIVTLHLSFIQHTTSNTNATICHGYIYTFNGLSLTTAGNYQVSLAGTNGCDSIAYLHLMVNQPSTGVVNATVCPHGTYNFNGRILTSTGTYYDTLTNALGCDSIVTLHLTLNTPITYGYNVSICSGHSYNFHGRILTTSGNYNDTLQTAQGCDSIVTVRLTVNQATASSITTSICAASTYSFGGRQLDSTGTYYDTLSNTVGCDSIITLHLTVNPPIRTGLHISICQGSTYSFNGQQLNTSGTYYAHLTSAGGCDSMITLVLQVNSYVTGNFNASICAGNSYTFNGQHLNQAGNYNDTLTAQGGCDSIVTLHLTVNQPTTGSLQASICSGGSYHFNGQNLTSAGTYTETLTGSNGCDSVVTLTLQISGSVSSAYSAAICQGTSYNFNGRSLTTSGIYYDTLTALGGCDSIVALTLTVNQHSSSIINASICVGSTYSFNGQQLSATGTYFQSLTGSNGCDSIVTLNLTVNSFVTANTAANICHGGTYNFNGQTLNTTGTYTDTLTAHGGCDSIITLSLIVNPVITHSFQANICDGSSYNFNGQQLNIAGTYYDTLSTHSGCDSVAILHLHVNSVLTSQSNASICSGSSYLFNGHALTTAGTYTDTLTAQGGCDSIATLNLQVIPGYNNALHQTICAGSTYNFNGRFLASAGTYADTLHSQGGCDSITTLYLTVRPSPVITWPQPDTICNNNDTTQITIAAPSPAGGTLSGNGLNGLVLTVSGTGTYPVTYLYVDSLGCSNTVTKNLLIESCLGIDELSPEMAISLYPNPANNIIVAQAEALAAGNAEPVVYDVTGKIITVPFTRQADKITFNTTKLVAGMYWIRFNINGNHISKRFVKID